jgi:hypothetical protein
MYFYSIYTYIYIYEYKCVHIHERVCINILMNILIQYTVYTFTYMYSGRQKFCEGPPKTMFFKMPITRATDKIAKFCKQL